MTSTCDIFVSGISGRFPESNSVSEFFDNLKQGKDLVTPNDSRWPLGIYDIPERTGHLPDVESIDASIFGMSGSQAEKLDPQLRLLLECTYESLNDAGIAPSSLRGSQTGVFVGGCFSDLHDYTLRDADDIIGYENTGCAHSMFANRLSFAFDWHGPSFTVDTACSSSLVAFVQAIKALRDGDCDVAVVGGSSVTLRPEMNLAFLKLHMLSPDGACRAFDTSANGYARSEGIGVVVLVSSRFKGQIREPYARVRGALCNNDGFTKKGITFPNIQAQIRLNQEILRASNVDPRQIDYIEAHGTGTTAGDGVELKALDTVYGVYRTPENPLTIGSVKSNMGHCEGASGIVSLIKVCCMFRNQQLPPNLHYSDPNASTTDCLTTGRMRVPVTCEDFDGRMAVINNFGFGGTNANVILESCNMKSSQTPSLVNMTVDRITPPPLMDDGSLDMEDRSSIVSDSTTMTQSMSYNSLNSLTDGGFSPNESKIPEEEVFFGQAFPLTNGNKQQDRSSSPLSPLYPSSASQLPSWIRERLQLTFGRTNDHVLNLQNMVNKQVSEGEVDPTRLPFTLGPPALDGREGWVEEYMPFRGSCIDGIQVQTGRVLLPNSEGEKPQIWFVFTGNGGIWLGMGKELYETSPLFKETLDEADEIAFEISGRHILPLVFATVGAKDVNPSQSMMAQVAIQIALVRILKEELSIEPAGILGHSAGEISCGFADGVLTMRQALWVVHHRNDVVACANLEEGHMYAVGLTREEAQKRLDEFNVSSCCVGCVNDPSGITLSGKASEIGPIAQALEEEGIFCRYVESKGIAHHSPMLVPLHDDLVRRIKEGIPEPQERSASWISTCVLEGSEKYEEVGRFCSAEYFAHNFISPVEFVHALSQVPEGAIVLEVGPHSLLSSPIRRSRSDLTYIPCMKKSMDATVSMLSAYASLWRTGALDNQFLNPAFPPSSMYIDDLLLREALIGWDHTMKFPLMDFYDIMEKEEQKKGKGVEVTFNLAEEDAFLFDHIIDGRPLMPGASYMYAAWKGISMFYGFESMDVCPIIFFDFTIHQAIQISPSSDESITLMVTIGAGGPKAKKHVEVVRDGELICSSKFSLKSMPGDELVVGEDEAVVDNTWTFDDQDTIGKNSFYTIIKRRGYDYGEEFRPVEAISADGYFASISFVHWIPFLDGLLQAMLSPFPSTKGLFVPACIGELEILPHLLDTSSPALVKVEPWKTAAIAPFARLANVSMPSIKRNTNSFDDHLVVSREQWVSVGASMPSELLAPQEEEEKEESKGEETLSLTLLDAFNPSLVEENASLFSNTVVQQASLSFIEIVEQTLGSDLVVGELDSPFSPFVEALPHRPSVLQFKSLLIKGRGDEEEQQEFVDKRVGGKGIVDYIAPSATVKRDGNLAFPPLEGSFDCFVFSTLAQIPEASIEKMGSFVKEGGFMLVYSEETFDALKSKLADFSLVVEAKVSVDASLFLLKKATQEGKNMVITSLLRSEHADTFEAADFEAWKASFLALEAENEGSTVLLLSPFLSGALGFYRCMQKEGHINLRLLLVDMGESSVQATEQMLKDAVPADVLAQVAALDLGILRYSPLTGALTTVSHFKTTLDRQPTISQPISRGHYLKFEREGDLESAVWVSNDFVPPALTSDSSNVQVDVQVSALNFKDVMLAYGKIDQSAFYGRPAPRSVGFELAGDILDPVSGEVTRRVMGMADDALATKVISALHTLWTIPEGWTYEEAASVPVVYATAYYALVVRGRLRKGQSVLIHAGTGGVGQAAIRVALNRGCEVFTTCSSQTKRDFLTSTFPTLKEENIFNSRSIEFEREVMLRTGGKGVHMVLNSLSEDKLQASLRCVKQHGHFLEIGKYDIMEHTMMDMHFLRKNITIHGIDVDQLKFEDYLWEEVYELMEEGLASGEVQPLPTRAFEASQVTEMFRFMGEGRHIGKIVLNLSDHQNSAIGTETRMTFETEGAILITGGLGGFGLELSRWLVEKGASHLLLSSRSGIRNGEQRLIVEELRSKGAQVDILTTNLMDEQETRALFAAHNVTSIFHLAMVLADTLFENLSGNQWVTSLLPKVKMTETLLAVSQEACSDLRRFITFSSISAGYGNKGQANYGYGNSFMDRLMASQANDAQTQFLSIQWGTIGDVGVAARTLDDQFLRDMVLPQSIASCLRTMEKAVLVGESGVIMSYVPPRKEDLSGEGGAGQDVVDAVLGILRLPRETVPFTSSLEALGMDSMQSVEVQNTIRRVKGVSLPVEKIQAMTLTDLDALA